MDKIILLHRTIKQGKRTRISLTAADRKAGLTKNQQRGFLWGLGNFPQRAKSGLEIRLPCSPKTTERKTTLCVVWLFPPRTVEHPRDFDADIKRHAYEKNLISFLKNVVSFVIIENVGV